MTLALRHDSPALRRVLKNFSLLLGGRAIGGVLAFAATALSARALGPAGFGVVAVVNAYMLVIRGILNIKPFEAVVRYGVPLLDDGNVRGLARLLRVSLAFDVATALAGTVLAVLLATLAAPLLNWNLETTHIAAWYCLVLLASGVATASGVLRIYDRFDTLSTALIVSNAWRFVGVLIVSYVFEPTVTAIAAVWASSQLIQYAVTLWFGWRIARARLPGTLWHGDVDFATLGRDHPGIWHFLHVVYWQSTLDLVPKSLGTLLAGTLLGTEGVAMFRVAREFSNVVSKPALLVRQAIYPDLARLRHRGDDAFSEVIMSVAVMMAGPALLLAVFSLWLGAPLLTFTVGSDYVAAAGLLSWLVAAAALELAAAPLRPAGYVLGVGGRLLAVQMWASLAFMLLFQLLTPTLGLTGPGVATVAMLMITLLGASVVVRRAL